MPTPQGDITGSVIWTAPAEPVVETPAEPEATEDDLPELS